MDFDPFPLFIKGKGVNKGFVKGEELFSFCDLTSSFTFIYTQKSD